MKIKDYIVIFLAVAATLLLPPLLWKWQKSIFWSTYGEGYQIFELFGFIGAAALFALAYYRYRTHKVNNAGYPIHEIFFLLLSFAFLIIFSELSHKSWDYRFIENAARALQAGKDPWAGTLHTYPPLTTRTMVKIHSILPVSFETGWTLVFFIFQVCEYWLIVAGAFLTYRFTKLIVNNPALAMTITALFFLFNNPLFRTIRFNQVNIWLYVIFLGTFLYLEKRPILSGISLALGMHIKIYPIIFLFPWFIQRRFIAVAAGIIGIAFWLLLQTSFFTDWFQWKCYLNFWGNFPHGWYFRDNSFHSLMLNTMKEVGRRIIDIGPERVFFLSKISAYVLSFTSLIYFAVRILKREYAFLKFGLPEFSRKAGHFCDTLLLMMFISPLVWEHHLIFAIPVAIWAMFTVKKHSVLVLIAALIIFLPPTFDIYPFSYHRLLGLLILAFTIPVKAELLPSPPFMKHISFGKVLK
ncbi:MAG: DUF2029 domain-containing protein [Fibrobacteres bacterium]|nr:DUF2029 domain-containing protein [Fibrobacterota bacterium]